MIFFRLRLFLLCALIFLATSVLADQPGDPADDPLPPGAVQRLGVSHMVLRKSPNVALIPPMYGEFLAPTTTGGVRRFHLGTGVPLSKGIVGPGRVVISADGKRAAVAIPDSVSMVDVATEKTLLTLKAPEGVALAGIAGLALSADGSVLAFCGKGKEGQGIAVVWHVDKNVQLAQFETIQAAPVYPNLSPDGALLVTYGPPPPVGAADPAKGAPAKKADPAKGPDPKPKTNPEAARTAQVWVVAAEAELFKARVTGMGGFVVASAFSSNGKLLALSAGDGPIDLFDIKTGKLVRTFLGGKTQGVKVAIAPDGKSLASIGLDYRVQVWSMDGKSLGFSGPPGGSVVVAPTTALQFIDNQKVVTWMTAGQFAVAWDAPNGKMRSPHRDHASAIRSIAFQEGKFPSTITSGIEGRILRWERGTGRLAETVDLNHPHIPGQWPTRGGASLAADGSLATLLAQNSEIYSLATGDHLFCVPPPSNSGTNVTMGMAPDGKKVYGVAKQPAGKQAGTCAIWDLVKQELVAEFPISGTNTKEAPVAALSRDGTRLVIAALLRNKDGKDAHVFIGYDVPSGKKLGQVVDPTVQGALHLAVPSQTTAIVTTAEGRVWSVDFIRGITNPDIDRIEVKDEKAINGQIAFSPDGKLFAIATVGEPMTTYGVRVYSWPDGKLVHTLIGHKGLVTTMRFTPDGRFLATGSQDTCAFIWDMRANRGK